MLLPFLSKCQEMWGISNSNYSGNMGIFLNPSTIVGAPYTYEYNLIAGDFFVENTYLYFRKGDRIIPRSITGSVPDGIRTVEDINESGKKGFGHVLLIGPSYIQNNGDHAWGIHTAFRSEVSALNVPWHLSKFIYEDYNYPSYFGRRFSSEKFSAATMSWLELGGTYGRVYRESDKRYIKWAINGNLMAGINGAYLDMRKFEYTFTDTAQMRVHAMDATFSHAADNDNNSNFLGIRGAGAGTTIGATYIRKRNPAAFDCNKSNDHLRKYKYRVGVSLMDVGAIRWFRQSRILTVESSNDRVWDGMDTTLLDNFQQLDNALVTRISGSREDKGFFLWLPTALSVQFDYSITPHLYANASLVNRLHFTPNQIARGNQAGISLRYEKRKWEANLNYNFFEYSQGSLGLGVRYWFFVIGSDRLLQTLGLSDVRAADFFFGFKWNVCSSLFGKNKGPDCPAFQ